MQEIDNLVTVFLATIGSYEADSLVATVAIAVAAWIFLFGYLASAGLKKPFWKSATSGQRMIIRWSWLWTSSAICVLVGGWGFLTWRMSNGLMLVPTAPDLLEGIVFGFVLLAAAILLLAGWLPRTLLPESNSATEAMAPIKRTAPVDEALYQPLYPGLSFEPINQPSMSRTRVEEPPIDQKVQAEAGKPVRPRRRLIYAVAAVVVVVGIVGALGVGVVPSAPAVSERFALADLPASIRAFFPGNSGDVIRDDAK